MPPQSDYELLDFGTGRKLERFGEYVLDRPAPQATNEPEDAAQWASAHARFHGTSAGQPGRWQCTSPVDNSWNIRFQNENLSFEIMLTPFGQVGLFPEQWTIWTWLKRVVRAANGPQKVLNLFAYTGASTLATALSGAEVVHVDASRTAVAWARRNAALSGLRDAPIRWIVDDALSFVRREIRRGHRYDGLVLDPPSFGRGPKGQMWQIEEHLDELLAGCRQLMQEPLSFFIVTCHSTGWTSSRLAAHVCKQGLSSDLQSVDCDSLNLQTSNARVLKSGIYVRGALPALI